MRAFFLLPLAFLLPIFGCSKPRLETVSLVHETAALSLNDALAIRSAAVVQCADPAHCPTNVGLFLAADTDSILSCTGFLVADDLVVTNSHCIPSAVKMLPDLCRERVQIIFPAVGEKKEERLQCAELVAITDRPNSISPDLALLKLSHKTSRAPLTVSSQGVIPGLQYRALKVNPTQGASGVIVQQDCLAVANSYRFPLYQSALDSIFATGDCESVAGNSGAPLIDEAGEAAGVFQVALPYTAEQKRVWGPYLSEGEDFAPLALGTSLICLQGKSLNPACAPNDEEEIVRPSIEDFLQKLRGFDIAIPLSRYFDFSPVPLRRQALEREETYTPRCFWPLRHWIGDFALNGGQARYYARAELGAEIPTIRAKLQFNRYLQTSAVFTTQAVMKTTFSFDPELLLLSGEAEVVSTSGFSGRLQECSPD